MMKRGIEYNWKKWIDNERCYSWGSGNAVHRLDLKADFEGICENISADPHL
jgi:hypothetical protein